MPDPNLADVGKRLGGSARDAAARHAMRPGNRETVTLTPSEVKAVQGVLGAKAQAVVSTLREAGMIGFRERVRGQKKQVF